MTELDLIPVPRNKTEAAKILVSEVAQLHGVSEADILGRRRTQTIARARRDAIQCVKSLGFSYAEAGDWFGRDPDTIRSACGKKRRSA